MVSAAPVWVGAAVAGRTFSGARPAALVRKLVARHQLVISLRCLSIMALVSTAMGRRPTNCRCYFGARPITVLIGRLLEQFTDCNHQAPPTPHGSLHGLVRTFRQPPVGSPEVSRWNRCMTANRRKCRGAALPLYGSSGPHELTERPRPRQQQRTAPRRMDAPASCRCP
jgi:hypothetical protein